MKILRQITLNFDKVDLYLAPSIYFVILRLIYFLFFLDMSFKLTFLKTKCFKKILVDRKIRCILARCFLEVFFID